MGKPPGGGISQAELREGVEVIQDGNSVPAGKPHAKINPPPSIPHIYLSKAFSEEFKEPKICFLEQEQD